ncbi:MAG: 2-polyprenyl-6-methoxyphenol hydroxylase-like FAD-dependent oxidoreductase [Limisphaerales bacterium]|jgi:2-polyprenyl-6-methoxyphenol hydroxylase-like FAD-dependent oxidoreductase
MTRTAVVIGGGIAGMCAAKVLVDHYDRVVLLERDKYPDGVGGRRGVPQSKMFHTLLERGRREIEDIFPGFHKMLDERKMPKVAFGFNCALMTPRGWGRNLPVPVTRSLFCTRAMQESTIRDLFMQEPRIELVEEAVVNSLLTEDSTTRKFVSGVTYKRRGESATNTLTAELVVDASGSGSKASQWLKAAGINPPSEDELDPLLTYGGQLYQMKPGVRFPKNWWWTHGAFIQRVPPVDNVAAHLIRQEEDLWLLTLVAGDGHEIPKDEQGIRDFLGRMRSPLIHDMLPYFEPLDEVTTFRLPKNRWKYYERWHESPAGFIAMAAATCVFNPNMGQGMSVAAGDAGILKQCLRETASAQELPELFFKRQAKFQKNAYQLACNNDLKFNTVVGPRTIRTRLFNWYNDQITAAAAADNWIARESGLINLLVEPISHGYRPWFVIRVLFARLFLWWRGAPMEERIAPTPPAQAEISTRIRSRFRNWFGTAFRSTRNRLGLAR